jgi:acetylornithine deacetylase
MSFNPVGFLQSAVQTSSHESVNAMRDLLVETLDAEGLVPRVDDAGNVIAERGGGSPHVVLNTHIDTVPPHVPFERTDDRIRGRGSCDAKGPLAAILGAFLAVEPTGGRVTLAVTPDEERDSTGAAALDLDPDGVIVGEPTGLDACVAARGRFEGAVRLQGTSAHAADPGAGTNAISALEEVLAGLGDYDDVRGTSAHPRLGAPTLTPTVVSGGEAANQVPADAVVTFDRRTVPPETEAEFFTELTAHLEERIPPGIDLEVRRADRETPFLAGFETDADAAVVEALVGAGAGEARTFGAATEASYFADMAPTVVFGPGVLTDEDGPVAHGDREYVEIDAVEAAGVILTRTLEDLVG